MGLQTVKNSLCATTFLFHCRSHTKPPKSARYQRFPCPKMRPKATKRQVMKNKATRRVELRPGSKVKVAPSSKAFSVEVIEEREVIALSKVSG